MEKINSTDIGAGVGGTFKTEVNIEGNSPAVGKTRSHISQEDEEDGQEQVQIFSVEEAEPPNDFESPFSKLPSNVVINRVKKNVAESLKNKYERFKKNEEAHRDWQTLF